MTIWEGLLVGLCALVVIVTIALAVRDRRRGGGCCGSCGCCKNCRACARRRAEGADERSSAQEKQT